MARSQRWRPCVAFLMRVIAYALVIFPQRKPNKDAPPHAEWRAMYAEASEEARERGNSRHAAR